ncbi:ervatamin-B-like [Abrus precatorius]|uniref:Ervatamin-B-like n=1 Tax=Abrus precatorius TaxID=3816 RepID=A0A8B8KJ35_ABRPR|nr:ervatamin-B-like [Abrus precatorius]
MAITIEIKHLIAIFIIFWTCAYPAMSRTQLESSVANTFQQWMSQYERSYADVAEKEKRFKIFMRNLEYIENFNNGANKSYVLGLNQFADLTYEEFIASRTGLKLPTLYSTNSVAPILNLSDVPPSMDWREKQAVTNVKDQGQCGSCWAFSAVAAMEGIVKIKTGKLISLSEQELVDCNQGCGGGFMDKAFNYVKQNQGLASENDYPYQGVVGTCQNGMARAAQISGYVDVPANNEEQLLQAVAMQPVSVIISTDKEFHLYKEGIFTGPCETFTQDHAVTAIGYGTMEDGTKYWLVKNSWGEGWGERGYMRLQRDVGYPEGLCGIAMRASYPTA